MLPIAIRTIPQCQWPCDGPGAQSRSARQGFLPPLAGSRCQIRLSLPRRNLNIGLVFLRRYSRTRRLFRIQQFRLVVLSCRLRLGIRLLPLSGMGFLWIVHHGNRQTGRGKDIACTRRYAGRTSVSPSGSQMYSKTRSFRVRREGREPVGRGLRAAESLKIP